MNDYFYDEERSEIFFYDTLKAYQLNDTATLVYKCYIQGFPASKIVDELAKEYEVGFSDAQNDVYALIKEFRILGIRQGFLTNVISQEDEFDQVGKNFHLHTPIVHIIQNCNSPCKMCDCWKTKERTWHPAKNLKPFFKKIKEIGAISVMISGGEPLLHPELLTILKDLKEIGLSIMLNTNGLLLHRNGWLSELGVEQLVVSMDGINPETYKKYRGLDGYQAVWKNLENFQKNSPATKIGIRTILNKDNFDRIDLLFDEIESRGMHSVGLSPADINSMSFSRNIMDEAKASHLIDLLLPSESQIVNFLENFTPNNSYYQKIEHAAQKGLSSWKANSFIQCMMFYLSIHRREERTFLNKPCLFPYVSMLLDYNGDLRNCFYSPAFGNLYKLDSVDWGFKSSMNELGLSGKCKNCRGKVFCSSEIPQIQSLAII